jgi:hypothetical protein
VPEAYFWQALAPSQNPVWPQVEAATILQVPVGSAPPAGTAEQVPSLPASAHELQAPVQAVEQQTPCAQTPCWHSLPEAQAEPSGFCPQLPPMHWFGDAQSASVMQGVVLQTLVAVSQAYGSQRFWVTVLQTPAPSQVRAGVWVEPVQASGAHTVPFA